MEASHYAAGQGTNFYYSVMSKARSDLRLHGQVVQTSYQPGSMMTLLLEPTLYGQPVKLNEPVEAHVSRPDGQVKIIQLEHTADGRYKGVFEDTYQTGIYPVSVVAWATTPLGAKVTRYRHLTGLIFRPGKGGSSGGKDEGGTTGCEEAGSMQKRLEGMLIRFSEKNPGEQEEVRFILDWLKKFIENCCKAKSSPDRKKLKELLGRTGQLLAEAEEA